MQRCCEKGGLKSGYNNPTNRRGMWQVKSADNEKDLWTTSVWKKVIGLSVQEFGLKRWRGGMKKKNFNLA